jgi:hypothetical protein
VQGLDIDPEHAGDLACGQQLRDVGLLSHGGLSLLELCFGSPLARPLRAAGPVAV